MSLLNTPLAVGDLRGTVYTFEKVGDTLPMHTHTDRDVHVTIVARGRVRISGPVIGDGIFSAGAVVDNDAPLTHEIVALEDDSRVVNIIKKYSGT